MYGAKQADYPYKNPTVAALVDIEEALKAGQAVEPRSDMQLAAEAITNGLQRGMRDRLSGSELVVKARLFIRNERVPLLNE